MMTDEEKRVEAERLAFNMWYPKTEGVQFDTNLFTDREYQVYGHLVGKTGVVVDLNLIAHAFAVGSVYQHDIDFDGEVVKGVFSSYLKYSKEILDVLDSICNNPED